MSVSTLGTTYYPAPAFSFSVTVAGTGTALQLQSLTDCSFQEVSGLEGKIDTEEVREGGENRFAHQLPGVSKYPNLSLKRGYVTKNSFLSEWASQTIGATLTQPILTQTLVVMLLGANQFPLASWTVWRAWPVRWVTGPFDSTRNDVLTEVLEFSYSYCQRIPGLDALAMVPQVAALIDF
jgi:phage tail-like protein